MNTKQILNCSDVLKQGVLTTQNPSSAPNAGTASEETELFRIGIEHRATVIGPVLEELLQKFPTPIYI